MVVQPNPNQAPVVAVSEDENCGARITRTRTAAQTNDADLKGYNKDATTKKRKCWPPAMRRAKRVTDHHKNGRQLSLSNLAVAL